jgi:hypothetical protein
MIAGHPSSPPSGFFARQSPQSAPRVFPIPKFLFSKIPLVRIDPVFANLRRLNKSTALSWSDRFAGVFQRHLAFDSALL